MTVPSLPFLVLSDRDITAKRLRDVKLVILPYHPALPHEIAREITRFLGAGGALFACKRYGGQCHIWKVNFNMGWATDQAFVAKMRSQGPVQVRYDGSVNERWLCTSHPANQRLEIESMLEVARRYDVTGLHFDCIRYPDRDGCFCEGCCRRFEDTIGKRIVHWPSEVREDPQLAQTWPEFRRRQITTVVAAVATQARQMRPGIRISAAVFRNWPVDRDTVGQDSKLWCEKGCLDLVCPMDHFSSSATFERAVVNQLQ
jgi:uncharacterized lipoprotein YddW (UPF0748 family)